MLYQKQPSPYSRDFCAMPQDCRLQENNRYLMQKIVSQSRIQERCIYLSLCADTVPCTSTGPYLLQSVTPCGQPEIVFNACEKPALHIPLLLTLSDSCGHVISSHGTLEYLLQLRGVHCTHDSVFADAAVSLIRPIKSESSLFQGQFSICASVYFLKHTVVCFNHSTCCTNVPLFPSTGFPCKRQQ